MASTMTAAVFSVIASKSATALNSIKSISGRRGA
jgi:hypothetical protein